MEFTASLQHLGVALGLGLLVGLQRERVASRLAGVRTFPLVTVLGSFAAMLGQVYGGWVVAAGWLALASMIVVGNVAHLSTGKPGTGLTTEIAMLLMFGVGAYLVRGHREVAIATGAGVAVLLQAKIQLHGLVARLGDQDLEAIMRFALISMVILPVLPDRAYGPYAVLNPYHIWLMVVLIVGISLAGYVAYKFFGERTGVLLAGFFGGLVSSTATTVSYSKESGASPAAVPLAAFVIAIASTVVFVRILLVIGIVAPSLLRVAAAPILVEFLVLTVVVLAMWRRRTVEGTPPMELENPSELKTGLVFALIYAAVIVAVAAAREHLGSGGLYLVAALSGLTDVDALTLSTAQLVVAGRLETDLGWRLIVTALTSNLVFKGVMVAVIARSPLVSRTAAFFAIGVAAGAALVTFWPQG
jgi:uncharacterized membrane protein (DUF4010 family)